jgi:hypothetical protein
VPCASLAGEHRASGATTAERAEAKIRARFPVYAGLPFPVVLTMRPPNAVAAQLAMRLSESAPAPCYQFGSR